MVKVYLANTLLFSPQTGANFIHSATDVNFKIYWHLADNDSAFILTNDSSTVNTGQYHATISTTYNDIKFVTSAANRSQLAQNVSQILISKDMTDSNSVQKIEEDIIDRYNCTGAGPISVNIYFK